MSKLKKRKVTGRYKKTTCHYCHEFYHSKIRQTSGEFVTRESKGKKVRVSGTTVFRFCARARAFTRVDDPICSDENFELAPMFHCTKRNCWLATNITCYASRARRLEGCLRCRQFDQIISKITETPAEDFTKRRSALSPEAFAENPNPGRLPKPASRIKRRRSRPKNISKPIVSNIKKSRLKRRRT